MYQNQCANMKFIDLGIIPLSLLCTGLIPDQKKHYKKIQINNLKKKLLIN